ncbi:MAG: primosomal protein N' [Candidatus Portnoybacteria bacterium CG10_big_fil_rev_8_21_14_0_10_44_7]|uniref:Primosomal protein N n=1 Tax=Candidatus Portnoybacteria bacterium CG10_big_fil_rev_8_21_14_0_10_44_7 TaxID=1974816 RepID=A0A2M8KJ36_9BACT|nr:MAG: primosomal protein N' [Candidatus Portnoybacteria bacterium CG10_big_fil_rev_8_21_14_0_10_44_7]
MYIIDVAPLRRIPRPAPQLLSYLSQKKLETGALAKVPLRKKDVLAVVLGCRDFDKQEIKRADFVLKPVSIILTESAVFALWQLKLAFWLGEYYFTSPGVFLKMMLPFTGKKFLRLVAQNQKMARRQQLWIVPTLADLDRLPGQSKTAVHSSLKNSRLQELWLKAQKGQLTKIAGTKIAAFLPWANLRQITILKESNAHHRSWDQYPHWRVHEVVFKIARLLKTSVALESSLPSVETFYYAKNKQINLKTSWPRKNPTVKIIDQRQELSRKNASIFSRDLQGAISHHLKKKFPVILFNLRRGAATFILCRRCGLTVLCPNCEVSLVRHNTRRGDLWLCHHCGFSKTPTKICPECGADQIREFGVGTQKVEAVAKIFWPQARVARLDSDATPTLARQQEIVRRFNRDQIDILIATPVIFSHLLKPVVLAAIISADTILNLPDFRSSERLFKIISLAKNFTKDEKSFLLIQTFNKDDRTLRLAAGSRYQKFYQGELQARKILDYPPFCQIIKVTSRHQDAQKAIALLKAAQVKLSAAQKQQKLTDFTIFGPLPGFIPKERGRYIYNLVIKFKPSRKRPILGSQDLRRRNEFLNYLPQGVLVDVDPESIL